MRSKAGDPPRTMSQKVLVAHQPEGGKVSDLVEVKIDQIVLARQPNRAMAHAVSTGLTRSAVEVSIAYPPFCIPTSIDEVDPHAPHGVPRDALALGFLIAQPGVGFAAAVHLERFGSPARLALTDDPRLAGVGASGQLILPASLGQISEALRTGKTSIRPPRAVQIHLTGRLRPFMGARDASLDLLRRGLAEIVQGIDAKYHSPVVLEFTGQGARFLSVGDRAVLCALAPHVGAAASLFPSDDKTEVFLRDQKRSKAHRSLSVDTGAPWDDVVSLDLAAVDPLLMDETGSVRPVRDFDGKPVTQVLLGGDTGCSLRDLLAAGALLKSKRVPPGIDFLIAPPSRQALEVFARSDALIDFIATGARFIESDRRVLTGELYPPRPGGVGLRNADPDISHHGAGIVASAETLAYAVAHGHVGDPRGFKRPVRITVPRSLPTDDVLIARGKEARGGAKGKGRVDKSVDGEIPPPTIERFAELPTHAAWTDATEACVIERAELHQMLDQSGGGNGQPLAPSPTVALPENAEDLQWLVDHASEHPELRAVIASHIPSTSVAMLTDLGILALRADDKDLARLEQAPSIQIPPPGDWNGRGITLQAGSKEAGSSKAAPVIVEWLAIGEERNWPEQS